jgi:tetratricopeptide (TPR) repeat protein
MRAIVFVLLALCMPACKTTRTRTTEAPLPTVNPIARDKFKEGVGHMDAGAERYDAAVAAFRAAIAQDAKLWEAWLDIGVIELRRARLTEAAKALEQSVSIHASPEALEALGEVYVRQGRAKRAVELYERALSQSPDDTRLRNALATSLRYAGRLDEAEAEIRAILGQAAFDPMAYATLAAIELDRGNPDLAELVLTKGLTKNPDHPLLLTNLGLVALKRGDDQTALGLFDKASAVDPSYVVGRLNKAAVFLGAGDHKRAMTECDAVLAIEPGNTDALLARGLAQRLAGDHKGARASWERVLAIDGDHAAAHFNLGVLELDFADAPESARKHLERYLQVADKQADQVAAAKERLGLLQGLRGAKGGKDKS